MRKSKLPYHREGLKNLLIEKGIEIVNTDGVQSFSLRKAAAACKVSHAAPYSHFRNKEELLNAMQLHITTASATIFGGFGAAIRPLPAEWQRGSPEVRSEEHTSELQ